MKNVQPCIRFFGNLFACNDALCSLYVKEKGILDLLKRVFTYCTKVTRKEALWLISNVAANSEQDANALADSPLMLNLLMSCRDTAHEVRKEAVWALSNVVYKITDSARIERIIESDVMSILLEMLVRDADSGSIASLALTSVNELLTKSENARMIFHRLGGQEACEDLQIS